MIPAQKIEIYSKCPRQYEYVDRSNSFGPKLLSPKAQLLKDVVRSSYMKAARHTRTNPWRQVTAEIDKFVFKDLPDKDSANYEEQAEELYKKSIKYIRLLQKQWYDPLFLSEGLDGFPDFKCFYVFGDIIITDAADLVLYNEKELIVCTFTDVEATQAMLYNSIRLRAQALMLYKSLGRNITRLRGMSWDSNTDLISVRDVHVHNHQEFMNKTEKTLIHILNGINNKVFYPAVNEQCSMCPYNRICSF